MLRRLLGFREIALVMVLVVEILFFARVQLYLDRESGGRPSWKAALSWEYLRANPFLNPTTLLRYFTGAVISAVASPVRASSSSGEV